MPSMIPSAADEPDVGLRTEEDARGGEKFRQPEKAEKEASSRAAPSSKKVEKALDINLKLGPTASQQSQDYEDNHDFGGDDDNNHYGGCCSGGSSSLPSDSNESGCTVSSTLRSGSSSSSSSSSSAYHHVTTNPQPTLSTTPGAGWANKSSCRGQGCPDRECNTRAATNEDIDRAHISDGRAQTKNVTNKQTSKSDRTPNIIEDVIERKSRKQEYNHEVTDFRQCGNSDIALDLRETMQHSNKLLSPEEIEKIPNIVIRRLLLGQWKYWNRPEIEQMKTLDGKELYRNYLSLPLGLDEGAKLVMYILHYLTLEETNKLSEDESCFTATWDDGTLKCNTPEFVRQSLGDKYYYPCGFVDTINVAIKYETELEDLVGEANAAIMRNTYWEDVLSIVWDEKDIAIAFGAGTSYECFGQMLFKGDKDWKKQFEAHHRMNPSKVISASNDPKTFCAPPHPCSLYQKGKQSNMETKLSKVDIFSTNVRRAHDPSAPPCEFGKAFWDTNSPVFRFLQRASLEGCSNGGQSCWKLMKAAVERFEAGEEPLDEDEGRIHHYLAFMKQSWDVQMIYVEAARIQKLNPHLDTSAILRQIKDSHPDIDEGAFKFFDGGEKQRKDVQMIYVEAARIQKLNPHLDTSAILRQIKDSNEDIDEGAFKFFDGGEKQRKDVQMIHAEAARIQKLNPFEDTSAILGQIKDSNEDINQGAFAVAKQGLDTKTVYAEAARIQKLNPHLDTSAILRQIKDSNEDIKKGAFAVAKQGLDTKTVYAEAARIQKLNPHLDTSAILRQTKDSHPDIDEAAFKFFDGAEKQRKDVQMVCNLFDLAKAKNPSADPSAILEQIKDSNENIPAGALEFVKTAKTSKTFATKRKRILSQAINSAESYVMKSHKNVEDITFSMYECPECANDMGPEYTDEHRIISADIFVEVNGEKKMMCLLCSNKQYLRDFSFVRKIAYAEVVAQRTKLDGLSGKKRKKPRNK